MKLVSFSIAFVVLLHGLVCNAVSIEQTSSTVSTEAKTVFCYISASGENYLGDAKLALNKIDVNMCNFYIYFEPDRVKIDSNGLPSYQYEAVGRLVSSRIARLKTKRSDFKIVLDTAFPVNSELVEKINKNNLNFAEYTESLALHIQKQGFAGFVLYFAWTGLDDLTINSFTKACSAAFKKRDLLLLAYEELPGLSLANSYNHFDYIAMNSAAALSEQSYLRLISPLVPRQDELDLEQTKNVEWFVNYYINLGFPRSKILLDVVFDSNSYKILDNNFKLGSPVKEIGITGPLSGRIGNPAHFEVCTLIKEDGWIVKYNEKQQGAYAYNKTIWITFENVKSLEAKAKYINEHDIGGAWLGSLQLDDHSGKYCGEGKYPLTTAFLKALNAN